MTTRTARPIRVNKKNLAMDVQERIVPEIKAALERLPPEEPLGSREKLAKPIELRVQETSGYNGSVWVQAGSRASKHKGAAVLAGALRGGTIFLYINGALTPRDILVPTKFTNRLSPLSECTHETCLPYGLYSTLLHEVTHAADSFKKAPQYDSRKVQEEDGLSDQYINDPGEVAAWLQQIVDEVETMAPKLDPHVRSDRDLVDKALLLSTTWSIVEDKLTRANKQKILKAVHQALDAAGYLGKRTAGTLDACLAKDDYRSFALMFGKLSEFAQSRWLRRNASRGPEIAAKLVLAARQIIDNGSEDDDN